MNASPSTTSTKPAIASRVSESTKPPSGGRAGAEQDEDQREAGDERHARERDTPRHAPLAEAPRLHRRDRGEVAGHSGSTQGVSTEMKPGEERDRDLAGQLGGVEAARARSSTSRSSSGSSCSRPGPAARGRCATSARRASRRSGSPPPADQRQQPGEQVEAVLRRRREDCLAELSDERVLDLRLRLPRRDPRAMNILMFCAIGDVRLVERRAADRAHDLALELVLASDAARSQARARPRRATSATPEQRPHAAPQRRRCTHLRRCPRSRAAQLVVDDRARAGRSRTSSAAPARRSGRAPCRSRRTRRVRDPVLPRSRWRGVGRSPARRRRRRRRPCRSGAARHAFCSARHLLLARVAPRAQKLSSTTLPRSDASSTCPSPFSRASRKPGAGRLRALRDVAHELAAAALVRHLPAQQGEKPCNEQKSSA